MDRRVGQVAVSCPPRIAVAVVVHAPRVTEAVGIVAVGQSVEVVVVVVLAIFQPATATADTVGGVVRIVAVGHAVAVVVHSVTGIVACSRVDGAVGVVAVAASRAIAVPVVVRARCAGDTVRIAAIGQPVPVVVHAVVADLTAAAVLVGRTVAVVVVTVAQLGPAWVHDDLGVVAVPLVHGDPVPVRVLAPGRGDAGGVIAVHIPVEVVVAPVRAQVLVHAATLVHEAVTVVVHGPVALFGLPGVARGIGVVAVPLRDIPAVSVQVLGGGLGDGQQTADGQQGKDRGVHGHGASRVVALIVREGQSATYSYAPTSGTSSLGSPRMSSAGASSVEPASTAGAVATSRRSRAAKSTK